MFEPPSPRRLLLQSAARVFGETDEVASTGDDAPPRLTSSILRNSSMSRNRDRVLANLDDMYREAFERAKLTADDGQMATLDFAYRREQLYFEILLDIRDAVERRG